MYKQKITDKQKDGTTENKQILTDTFKKKTY